MRKIKTTFESYIKENLSVDKFDQLRNVLSVEIPSDKEDKYRSFVESCEDFDIVIDILSMIKTYYNNINSNNDSKPNLRNVDVLMNRGKYDLERIQRTWREQLASQNEEIEEVKDNDGYIYNKTIRLKHKYDPAYVSISFDRNGRISNIENRWDIKLPEWFGYKVSLREVKNLLGYSEFKDYYLDM